MTQQPNKNNLVLIIVAVITVFGTVMAAAINVMGNLNVEKIRQGAELTRIALEATALQVGSTPMISKSIETTSADGTARIYTPYTAPESAFAVTASSSKDLRDTAAQTLGYVNLDTLMATFGIPIEVRSRVFVCPNEEDRCLSVYEEPGQADFHFKNMTRCVLDGKQANGTSTIPVGFDGMVKGFTLRPCSK